MHRVAAGDRVDDASRDLRGASGRAASCTRTTVSASQLPAERSQAEGHGPLTRAIEPATTVGSSIPTGRYLGID